MKTQILAAIGEHGLQSAAAVNAGLAANDRIKYIFSLLQMALTHGDHPDQPASSLKRERIGCGIDDSELDNVVTAARMVGSACRIQGAPGIMARIAEDMRLMAAPVIASGAKDFAERLDKLLAAMPDGKDDLLDPEITSAMMRAAHGHDDSLHRLVMDLHKQLNTMQVSLAEENIDGAATYNLDDADRPLVAAFMAGLNRTARLKFGHPGLATTATRAGQRLVIQNDIGTTDAHVIVIHVQGLTVTVIYTDVHPERLAFFQDLLKPRGVAWESQRTAVLSAGSPFFMATGRFDGADAPACRDYLEFLGSRLVFLIDWNRARKQLRQFLRGPDRVKLLAWAAESDIGHRGFLELGGARLVNHAIEESARSSMHFGDRLCDVLGDDETTAFLRFVFQTATHGLTAGASPALINDRIRVALAAHFSNEERRLLRLAADHAGLIFELAALVRDCVQSDGDGAEKRTKRARRFEHDADRLVVEAREAVHRRPDFGVFLTLLQGADDAADELEDAAFLLNLESLHGKPLEDLLILADLLADASQEWIKALGHAAQIGLAASRAESEDFLTAIDRVLAIEHQADDAERALAASAVRHAKDFRQLHLFTTIGARFEAAADALKHVSLVLRDHVLEDVIDG